MKIRSTRQMHTSLEDKLLSIQRFGFHVCTDLVWVQSACGMVIFRANGSVWSTTPDIFQLILQINPHGCTNLP